MLALPCLLVAGILVWLGLVLASMPSAFAWRSVDRDQYAGLGISAVISILIWLRVVLVFTPKLAENMEPT